MAQDFAQRYPQVDGQGNFGSVDNDPPAAMRYTESRMSKAAMSVVADLDKDTVDFKENYDGTEQEQAITAAQQAAESAKVPPPNGAADAPPPAPTCDATQVQGLVGQVLEDATAEQARADAGAKTVRVLEPDQMVTMEFDGERLNIEVDATKKIVAVRCG